MILDSYYHFKKLPGIESKTRLDLIEYCNEYEPLHKPLKRSPDIVIYLNDSYCVKEKLRKSDKTITQAGNNISSIYIPNLNKPDFGYGDCRDTMDALLMIIQENEIELFIAKGKKKNVIALFNLFIDGEFENEIRDLKRTAIKIKMLN